MATLRTACVHLRYTWLTGGLLALGIGSPALWLALHLAHRAAWGTVAAVGFITMLACQVHRGPTINLFCMKYTPPQGFSHSVPPLVLHTYALATRLTAARVCVACS